MPATARETAFMDAVYKRSQKWRKYRYAAGFGAVAGLVPTSFFVLRDIENPHTSPSAIAVFYGLICLVWGMVIMHSILVSRQRQRDNELIRFLEQRFSDDCPWKQEERILAEVEDLRLKAKSDLLIHKASSS